jgi:hypothetical protein
VKFTKYNLFYDAPLSFNLKQHDQIESGKNNVANRGS